jgi:hypothetical protein
MQNSTRSGAATWLVIGFVVVMALFAAYVIFGLLA